MDDSRAQVLPYKSRLLLGVSKRRIGRGIGEKRKREGGKEKRRNLCWGEDYCLRILLGQLDTTGTSITHSVYRVPMPIPRSPYLLQKPIPSSGESVMKAVSCQNGGRGLPSCIRDWALRLTLRSLNWDDMLRASRTNFMFWPMLGGSSS